MDKAKILELFHNIWKQWVKDLIKDCEKNKDGSLTIPTHKVRFYLDNCLLPSGIIDYNLSEELQTQIYELFEQILLKEN